MSDFSRSATYSLMHSDRQFRSTMERRLNRFLLRYAQQAEDRGEHEKADRVRRETIPRWPLPET
jgi:hypothetical protein